MVIGITKQFAIKAMPAQQLSPLQHFCTELGLAWPFKQPAIPTKMLVTATIRLVEKQSLAMIKYLAVTSIFSGANSLV